MAESDPAPSLLTAVRRVARSQPDRTAVIDGDTTLTYAQLEQESDRVCALLGGHYEVQRNDIVAIQMPNSWSFVTALLGVLKVGAAALLLDPLLTAHEVGATVDFCRPAAIILGDQGSHFASETYGGTRIVRESELVEQAASAAGDGDRQLTQGSGGSVAVLILTSGTTGAPKIVPITHDNLVANAMALNGALSFKSDSRSLITLPLSHASALVSQLTTHLLLGGSVLVVRDFLSLAMRLRGPTQDLGVTDTSLAPSMVQSLLGHGLLASLVRMGVRLVQVVGAPFPARHYRDAANAAPGLELVKCYGLTEATCRVSCLRSAEARPDILESSGRLLPGMEIRIAGSQSHEGEILVAGPGVVNGYWNNRAATSEAFVDGYLRTGDLGYVNEEGFLFIRGRRKQLISVGSHKVLPQEIEETLQEHPDVGEVAAVGVPDNTMGERVAVGVVPRAGKQLSVPELHEFCRQRLAVFKLPSTLLQLRELPRTARGKIDYTRLRETLSREG